MRRKDEKTVKVWFSDGDSIITTIYGSKADVMRYYRPGTVFNLGTYGDRLVSVVRVDILFSDNDM